ncbi:MAG: GatB/YqeY domain-containing protein [Bacteroidetes bacterium]|jgi:uncharacterized protein|nr:GatB/YqeY domain-containing protein [Bacteroidota bacterium]
MTLTEQINEQLKAAMKAKDQANMRSLRAIKSALLILNTSGGDGPTEADEIAALVKMAKQRKDSLALYVEQNRPDLAKIEEEELEVIETFLPKQLSESEITEAVQSIMAKVNAQGMKDMGKVMGMANQQLKGKADGKLIADIVKKQLMS